MYIITADENIFHDSDGNDPDYLLLEGTLNKEFNKSGTMSFKVPPRNIGMQEGWFNKLKTIIRVYKKVDRIWKFLWKGRILDTSKDFIGSTTFNCEGWMSVLCDSIARPITISGGSIVYNNTSKTDGITVSPSALINWLINKHNEQVDASKQLTLITNGISNTAIKFPCPQYETILDYIQTNFLENEDVGGMMWIGIGTVNNVEQEVLYYYSDDASNVAKAEQEIVFGENLLDFTEAIDASEIYTVIIPTGKSDNNNGTVKINNGGVDYYPNASQISNPQNATDRAAAAAINMFGKITRQVDFSDVADSATLLQKAKEDLEKNIVAATTIDISAFDLSLLDFDIPTLDVGTMVRVISPPHNFDNEELCRSVAIDLVNPANTRYTLGVDPKSMTRRQTKLSRKITGDNRYVSNVIGSLDSRVREIEENGSFGYLMGPDSDFVLDSGVLDTGMMD